MWTNWRSKIAGYPGVNDAVTPDGDASYRSPFAKHAEKNGYRPAGRRSFDISGSCVTD